MNLHEIWLRSPLLRMVLPLLAGIYGASMHGIVSFCVLAISLYACYFLMRMGVNRHWKTHQSACHIGIFYSMLWLAVGVAMSRSTNRTSDEFHALRFSNQTMEYVVRITDEPIVQSNRWKVRGEVLAAHRDSVYEVCRGGVALTIEHDSTTSQALHADDVIIARITLRPPDEPLNPCEFDYATYLKQQDVWLQAYVEKEYWTVDTMLSHPTIRGTLIRWREYLLHELSKTNMDSRELGVLSALVLGKSSAIDREVMQTYASAGVVHVLAVSGMHVALIYWLLKPLFERLWGRSRARKLKTLIPVVLLWLYAAITGFSPSVLRAAWMFSFVIVADNFGLRNTIYNTMAASAILLLAFDPQVAFSMGFMLSYLAVVGISAIHPALHRLIYFQNRFGKWLWELSSVSISAQLATMPLTLYLFHQFPTWFVITNAMVIPLSTVILYLALFFFAVLAFPPITSFVGGLLGLLTRIMNDLMQWSATWPHALIDRVYWEPWEAVVCAVLICCTCATLLGRSKRSLLLSMVLAIVWLVANSIQLFQKRNEAEVCIHSSYSGESITAYNQGTLNIISSNVEKDNRLLNYRLSFESAASDTFTWNEPATASNTQQQPPWMQVNDCLLLIADSTLMHRPLDDTSIVVYFTDSGKPRYWKMEELRKVHGHTVILGNNLSRKRRAWLNKELGDSCSVVDLSKGAVIWRKGKWQSYRN